MSVKTRSTRDFPYSIITPKMQSQWSATNWCTDKFGKRWSAVDNREGVWCCFWRGRTEPGMHEWWFVNSQDAALFALKWL